MLKDLRTWINVNNHKTYLTIMKKTVFALALSLITLVGVAQDALPKSKAPEGARSYIISPADEAVEIAANLEGRLQEQFADGFEVEMTVEPVAAQSSEGFSGGLFADEETGQVSESGRSDEPFYTEFRIARVGR